MPESRISDDLRGALWDEIGDVWAILFVIDSRYPDAVPVEIRRVLADFGNRLVEVCPHDNRE